MKVLVLGAMGQVGQEVVLAFAAQGCEVIALGSKDLDITNDAQVLAVIQQHQDSDYIINCSAYTLVDKAEDESPRAYAVNALGVKSLAEHAKACRIPVLHISTDYVFDGTKAGAYLETDKPNPMSIYGASKLAGEQMLQVTWEQHIILRVSWVFGRFGNNFVKTIKRLAAERSELKIVADQHGSPTGAAHIAQVILTLLQHPALSKNWGIYHYTDAPQTTWYDFAKSFVDPAICTLVPITTAEYPVKARRPSNSVLNCDKIKQVFGVGQYDWHNEL